MNVVVKKVASIVAKISPEIVTKVLFKHFLGYPLNMKHPRTLNEKMQYLKLRVYKGSCLVSDCVDKVKVRDYVASAVGEQYLTKMFGSWECAKDIDYDMLPDEFVLKCNHGSGSNIICNNKDLLDKKKTNEQLDTWLTMDFGSHRAELMYRDIDRKILCEEFINTFDGKPPKDYKFFCCYGKAKFLFVASDRYDDNTKFDYYDMDWNWIPVKNGHPNAGDVLEKPSNFDEMIAVAEKLSKPFPLVRVDLYNENGKIIFGELTFLHFAGLTPFVPEEYDLIFGDMADVDVTKCKGIE